jgi:NitT/TauT family transport system permease protein
MTTSITNGLSERSRRLLSPILALGIWKILSLIVDRSVILPSPEETVVELLRIAGSGEFLAVIGATFLRVLISFLLALGAALATGILAGLSKPVEDLFTAPVTTMRAAPTMGVVLIALIWLDSEGAPLLVVSLVTFPILYAAVVAGIHGIDEQLLEMHEVFRIGFAQRLRHFYLPSLVPHLKAGIAAALGLNVKVMIAAEVLSQPRRGIGTMFQIERAQLNTPGLFAWCAIVVVLAYLLDQLLTRLAPQYAPKALRRRGREV